MMEAPLLVALAAFTVTLVHALVMEGWRTSIRSAMGKTDSERTGPDDLPPISVIIPARDAAATIGALLQDLYGQDHPRSRFEVIVVDDHSNDNTADLVRQMMKSWPELKLIQLDHEFGKKGAIMKAAAKALHDIVLITDADARCGRSRLRTIARFWTENGPDLLLMPVETIGERTAVEVLQRMEQLALQAVTAGSATMGLPILANGANMAFSRSTFFQLNGFTNDRWASGDDMFLLQRMRRARKQIQYLLDPGVIVTVRAESSLLSALQQRLRWAGKMRAYREGKMLLGSIAGLLLPWLLATATIHVLDETRVGGGLMSTLLLLISAWLLWSLPIVRLVHAMDKFFALAKTDQHLQKRSKRSAATALLTIPALIAFMIYAPIIAIVSIFVRPIWKGRRI